MEVSYKKEVPTSKKIDPDILVAGQKASPIYKSKQGRKNGQAINSFKLGVGNINLFNYKFLHGQTIQDHSYLLSLTRLLVNDYIPYSGGSKDKIGIDYTYRLASQETLSLAGRFERRKFDCPSKNGTSLGSNTGLFLPLKITYQKELNNREQILGDLTLENLDTAVPGQARNLLTMGLGLVYDNALDNTLLFQSSAVLVNRISRLGLSLKYQPQETDRVRGRIGLDYYGSFLPRVANETLIAANIELRYDFSDNTYFKLLYKPKIVDVDYLKLYVDRQYSEINYTLRPQIDTAFWQGELHQKLTPKLNWDLLLGLGNSRQVIGYADLDNNGFVSPQNMGDGTSVLAAVNLYYDLNQESKLKLTYDYQNLRLDSGLNLPGISMHSLILNAGWEPAESGFFGNLSLSWQDEQIDILNNSNTLPSYILVNLEGTKTLGSNMKVRAGIKNLFNTVYYQRSDFPEPGLSVELGTELLF
ncbi:hypothetical protein ACFL4D_02505 [Candidatus Margulisiibacteriota bacterium]